MNERNFFWSKTASSAEPEALRGEILARGAPADLGNACAGIAPTRS